MLLQGISDPLLLGRAKTEGMVCQVAILAVSDALVGIVVVIFNYWLVKHLKNAYVKSDDITSLIKCATRVL